MLSIRFEQIFRILFFFIFICAISAAFVSQQELALAQPTGTTNLKVGVATARTSNVALLGSEQIAGVEIARDWLNGKIAELITPAQKQYLGSLAKGGLQSSVSLKFEILIEDSGGDEASAMNAFQKLMSQDVIAIVGPTLSQQAFATNPMANRKGFPVLAMSNTAKGIPQIGDFVTRVSAPITAVAPQALKAALKQNPALKKVVTLFAQNDAFSTSESATFQELVKNSKLELVSVLKFQTTDSDFTTQVREVMKAAPDLVIISGLAADGGNLLKQLKQTGYRGLVIGGNGFNSPSVFPICQKFCDGLLVAQAYSPEAIKDSFVNKEFVEAFEKKFNRKPGQIAAQAFAALQVVADSIFEMKTLDPKMGLKDLESKSLREALNKKILSSRFETPLGPISFDRQGELIQSRFYVAQIKMDSTEKNGRFVILQE